MSFGDAFVFVEWLLEFINTWPRKAVSCAHVIDVISEELSSVKNLYF